MSMSMFSMSPAVERNRSEANSALPDAPVIAEHHPHERAHRSYGARRVLARLVRRAARSQLAWACRLDAPAHH